MPSTPEAISAFSHRHPRFAGWLYQVFLYCITLECVVALMRCSSVQFNVPYKHSFKYICDFSATGSPQCHITSTKK
jgi:hypothetical protein